jgi:hypothetical protein
MGEDFDNRAKYMFDIGSLSQVFREVKINFRRVFATYRFNFPEISLKLIRIEILNIVFIIQSS